MNNKEKRKLIEKGLQVYKTTESKIDALTDWIYKDLNDLKHIKSNISTVEIYATNLCMYIAIRKKLIKENLSKKIA